MNQKLSFLQNSSIIYLFLILLSITSCQKTNDLRKGQSVVSSSKNESVAASSLVAWYKFTNGNTNDLSAYHNHIIFNNATKTTDFYGRANNAYYFNGNGSYMEVANSTSLNPSKITLAALIEPMGYYMGKCHANRILMKGFNDGSDGLYLLGYSDDVYNPNPCGSALMTSKVTFVGAYGNGGNSAGIESDPNTFVNLNKWYKLVYSFDGTTANLYINDVLVNQKTFNVPFTPNTSSLKIGTTNDSNYPYWFNGKIDEIRIYNTAVNSTQAIQISKQLGKN